MDYKPPYTITTKIVNLVAKITECAVRLSIQKEVDLRLCKLYIKPALQSGLIELTVPDKPKTPKQQYRLTEKGKLISEKPY